MAARFLQAQQNHHLSGTNLPELALQQQLFGHQLLQQKILEEQLARNRDFFLVSEQAEREKHASQLGLIFHQVRFLSFFLLTMVPKPIWYRFLKYFCNLTRKNLMSDKTSLVYLEIKRCA